ncbi:flagellar FlbD family protein [Glutamicibacter sp. MCAF14]|uniref:flagellar FlbD family protein n=1 Tax=Glutamicibacter sp. MCAF14 TaxID=3233043 RepID=UPI003F91CD31
MIVLTRLNGTRLALNADLVERITQAPDTLVVMANGAQYVVRETMDEVIALAIFYRARVLDAARLAAGAASPPAGPQTH